jgi:hypothetical protein
MKKITEIIIGFLIVFLMISMMILGTYILEFYLDPIIRNIVKVG